ncbi:MAG: hypothetical protein IJ143_06305 [Neisseriaceae bacterium]|nr:hypothetical protein [Neisseriaceae bacterium]
MPNWCSNILNISGSPKDIQRIKDLCIRESEYTSSYDGKVYRHAYLDFNGIVPEPREITVSQAGWLYNRAIEVLSYPLTQQQAASLCVRDLQSTIDKKYYEQITQHFNPDMLLVDMVREVYRNYKYRNGVTDKDIEDSQNLKDDDTVNGKLGFDQAILQINNLQKYGHKDWYEWRRANWGVKWNVDSNSSSAQVSEQSIHAEFDTPWSAPKEWYRRLIQQFPDIHLSADYLEAGCDFAGYFENDGDALYDNPANDTRQYAIDVFGYEYEDEEEDDGEAELAALDDAALAKQGSLYFYLTPAEIKKIVDYANANYASVNQASDFEVALGFFTNLFDEKDILVTKDRSCIEVKGFPMYFNDDGSIKSSEPLQCLLEKYLSGKCK